MRALPAVLLLAVIVGCGAQEEVDRDRAALMTLKEAVSDYGRSKIKSWGRGDPCKPKPWKHVGCSAGRVTSINLANLGVTGKLPAKLSQASELEVINFEGNSFTGNIPSQWADKTLFNHLKVLNLADNALSGVLPNWNRNGAFNSLRVVDLSGNQFYGGLPANWLGKNRPLDSVELLDLADNNLGKDADGQPLAKAVWCKTETAASLSSGGGWCPENDPLPGTVSNLAVLDLSGNSLTGVIPDEWPVIFRSLETLYLHGNNLYTMDGSNNPVASALPHSWTSAVGKAFSSLSTLTLWPGNPFLCSVPALDGGFNEINLDGTYRVSDQYLDARSGDDPQLCPTAFVGNNAVSGASFPDKDSISWTYTFTSTQYIWGYKVTLYEQDAEGGVWTAVNGWTGNLLRVYTLGQDGFEDGDVEAQGLVCASGTCTLTFDDITTDRFAAPDLSATTADVSTYRLEVVVINLDGVLSTSKTATLTNS